MAAMMSVAASGAGAITSLANVGGCNSNPEVMPSDDLGIWGSGGSGQQLGDLAGYGQLPTAASQPTNGQKLARQMVAQQMADLAPPHQQAAARGTDPAAMAGWLWSQHYFGQMSDGGATGGGVMDIVQPLPRDILSQLLII